LWTLTLVPRSPRIVVQLLCTRQSSTSIIDLTSPFSPSPTPLLFSSSIQKNLKT
jgi:hypothetical protein